MTPIWLLTTRRLGLWPVLERVGLHCCRGKTCYDLFASRIPLSPPGNRETVLQSLRQAVAELHPREKARIARQRR